MTTKKDFIQVLNRDRNRIGYWYDPTDDNVKRTDNDEVYMSIDEYYKQYLEYTGESLEVLRKDMGDGFEVLRCTRCKCVIFSNTAHPEKDLRCPVCTDYQTHNRYWTAADVIMSDRKKRKIDYYIKWQKDVDSRNERYEKTGKSVREIATKVFEKDGRRTMISLRCDDVRKFKLKGLYLYIRKSELNLMNNIWFVHKQIRIPLSWSHFSTYCLHRDITYDLNSSEDE